MTTDVLSPSGASVAPASSLLIILTWFGTFSVPTVASGSRLKVIRYCPVLSATPVTWPMRKL